MNKKEKVIWAQYPFLLLPGCPYNNVTRHLSPASPTPAPPPLLPCLCHHNRGEEKAPTPPSTCFSSGMWPQQWTQNWYGNPKLPTEPALDHLWALATMITQTPLWAKTGHQQCHHFLTCIAMELTTCPFYLLSMFCVRDWKIFYLWCSRAS